MLFRSALFPSAHVRVSGLLLDLDDLVPTTSAAALAEKSAAASSLPPYTPTSASTDFRLLPENPHALVDISTPTFPLAVSMYRALIVDLATNHSRRQAMGAAAAVDASRRSWHGAMEMLVDGFREIAKPLPTQSLTLSRTSTIEVDVVEHCADSDTYAESTAADSRAKRRGVSRVLRLGGEIGRAHV